MTEGVGLSRWRCCLKSSFSIISTTPNLRTFALRQGYFCFPDFDKYGAFKEVGIYNRAQFVFVVSLVQEH